MVIVEMFRSLGALVMKNRDCVGGGVYITKEFYGMLSSEQKGVLDEQYHKDYAFEAGVGVVFIVLIVIGLLYHLLIV